jgi:hypothetical protein
MSGQCNPLHLPILVEPKCASSYYNDCSCDKSSCSVNCDLNTAVYTQGTYQNQCTKDVNNIPTLAFASLSNVRNVDCPPQSAIKLNAICLTWCEFLRLFYPNNSFRVSIYERLPCATIFSAQTYEDTTSPCLKFYLAEFVRRAWEEKCGTSAANLPLKTGIMLEKETTIIRSIYSSTSVTALTLDEIIGSLLQSNQIEPADSTSSAKVVLTLEYIFFFKPLNLSVQVNFNYKTAIPCYKNTELCASWCPVYSNCSNCGDIPIIPKGHEISDNESILSGDNSSVNDLDTFNEQMKELINRNDDNKSFVSVEESKW